MTEAAQRKPVPKPPGRLPVSAPVLWTGLALGTFLAVLALTHGVLLPGLNGFLAAILTFVLLLAAGVGLAELTRRHHRTAARHGKRGAVATARHGRRGAIAAAGHARRHGGTAFRWLAVKAASRWENREHRPLMFRRLRGEPEGPEPQEDGGGGERGSAGAEGRTYSWGPAGSPSGWPADDAETAHRWARHMSTDGGKPQVVTEYPPGGGPGRTAATYINGKQVQPTEGTNPMTTGTGQPSYKGGDFGMISHRGSSQPASPSRIKTEHRAQRAAARSGSSVPSEWGPVIAQTADFEPEDDGQLLEWMGRQVTGLSAWAEALVDFYDHATNTIGIDPKASAMLHDVADAAAQAAETMGAAKAKFTEHYELPREFAGNGGLMTHDGRWITGEGA